MIITPHGAAGGEVTGSAYLIKTNRARVLVDCGLFQGGKRADELNQIPGGPGTGKVDAVLITHAHLDHVGRLPLLVQCGYAGPIFATPATIQLAGLVLRDSAKVQRFDAERRNRRLERAGKPLLTPLYTIEAVEKILTQFRPVPYQQPVEVAPGICAIWAEAGHMLGSASLQLLIEDEGRTKRVVFSGDLGPIHAPILREFEPFDSEAAAKKNIVEAVENVAKKRGNTRTVCRKCYIHPAVMSAYLDGDLADRLKERARAELKIARRHGLDEDEEAVLRMLEAKL